MINELFFDKSIKSSEYIQYHTYQDNFVYANIHQYNHIQNKTCYIKSLLYNWLQCKTINIRRPCITASHTYHIISWLQVYHKSYRRNSF